MVATSSLGCQHLSQRNASANAEAKGLGDRPSEQVLDQERDHIKLRVRAGDGERRGGGGGLEMYLG